jgi:hypothetical protein
MNNNNVQLCIEEERAVSKEVTCWRAMSSTSEILTSRSPVSTTKYLEPPLSLATPNGFEQTRSLGASAPGDLLIAPSGIFEYSV